MRIPLSAPDLTEAEVEAVTAVLRTSSLSLGPRLVRFEQQFAATAGAAHAVAVSSGTAGLHLCVRACGLGPGDEVLTTPFSYVASANALLYERAVPAFVDVEPVTLNLDPARLAAAITPRTRAILAVHVFGRPAAMKEIVAVAERHDLQVIEDACEALGAEVEGRPVGTFGRCGVFAFYPNKQITTGEGGMIVTRDPETARICRSLRNQGRDEAGEFVRLGYNYRLSELACALGIAQLESLAAILARREAAARRYHERLAGCPDLMLPEIDPPHARTSWFVYVVRLGARFTRDDRDRVVASLRRRGIGCQTYFAPLHLMPHLRDVLGHRRGDFPVAETAAERTLALPLFSGLTDGQVDEVCDTLLAALTVRQ